MQSEAERKEEVLELLAGGYDLHVHTSPSHRKRSLDDIEFARELSACKMRGGIIKNHNESTAGRAYIANKYSNADSVLFGAITLNRAVGGINPDAVEKALQLGAKMVWLPTLDVKTGLSVMDEQHELVPELFEIFELVRQFDACLATGHLKPLESLKVCKAAVKERIKIILTHPDAKKIEVPLSDQIEAARSGVMIEKTWGNVYKDYISGNEMVESIRAIGSSSVFLVTDFGAEGLPRPTEGMYDFVDLLLESDISRPDISKMIKDNPQMLMND